MDTLNQCPGTIQVPTEREREALAALRAVKEEVKRVKEEISALSHSAEEHAGKRKGLEDELARLKTEWDSWQKKRLEAEKERMILLGHEEA
jgi:predicted RNase H-like nuclease (RuvC/YqgF family)